MVTPTAIILLEPSPAELPPPSPPSPVSEPELPPSSLAGLAANIIISGGASEGSSVADSVLGSVSSVGASTVSSGGCVVAVSSGTVGSVASVGGISPSSISAANAVTAPRGKHETASVNTSRSAMIFLIAFIGFPPSSGNEKAS